MNGLLENVAASVAAGTLVIGSAMIDVSDPVIVAAGGAMLTALGGTVKVLWERNNKLSSKTDEALTRCEEEHKKAAAKYEEDQKRSADHMNVLVQQVITLSGDVGLMKGRIQGFQEATEKADRDKANHEHTA